MANGEGKSLKDTAITAALVGAIGAYLVWSDQKSDAVMRDGFKSMSVAMASMEDRLIRHDDEQSVNIFAQHNKDIANLNIKLSHIEQFMNDVKVRWATRAQHEEDCARERQAMREQILHLEHEIEVLKQ